MKVISVDFNALSYKGGIASFNRKLMSFFGKESINFITFFNDGNRRYINEKNYNLPKGLFKFINSISLYYISSIILYFNLVKVVNKKDTILILNSPSFFKLLPKGFKKVILIQHQDSETMWSNRSGFNSSSSFLSKCVKKASKIVVLSDRDREDFSKKLNIPYSKMYVIPHSVDIDISNTKKLVSKKLIMVARIDNRQKRLDLAIKAMKFLPDWQLDIYGKGNDLPKLLKLIEKNSITNVFFKGLSDNVTEAYDSGSIHVMTSDFEGFGITNIEAMARGLPLIIRATFPASQDIIKNGEGILLAPDWDAGEYVNAVKTIYNSYHDYSQRCKKSAENYSHENVKKKWVDFLAD